MKFDVLGVGFVVSIGTLNLLRGEIGVLRRPRHLLASRQKDCDEELRDAQRRFYSFFSTYGELGAEIFASFLFVATPFGDLLPSCPIIFHGI